MENKKEDASVTASCEMPDDMSKICEKVEMEKERVDDDVLSPIIDSSEVLIDEILAVDHTQKELFDSSRNDSKKLKNWSSDAFSRLKVLQQGYFNLLSP